MKDTKEILETIMPTSEYSYEQAKIGKILYSMITNLNYNRARLEKLAKEDEREFKGKIEIHRLYQIAQEFYQKSLPMGQEEADKKQVDGLGTIGVMYHGEPEVTLTLALMAIRTHNNMVFFVEENTRVNHLLIQILQDTMKECEYVNGIYEIEGFKEEFVSNQSFFDFGILIGDKKEYQIIKEKVEVPLLYHGFGSVSIYADDSYFKEVLMQVDEYVYDHNIRLQYFHDMDLQEDIKKINQGAINDCVAIFTKDFKKAYDFISKVKAKKVYVNTNPFLEYSFDFEEEDLILKKKIVIQN